MSLADEQSLSHELHELQKWGSAEDAVEAFRRVRFQMEAVHQLGRSLTSLDSIVSPAAAARAQATENAWRTMAEEFGLLTAAEVAVRVGAGGKSYASDARRDGRLLGVKRLNRVLYPGFQINSSGPLPLMRAIRSAAERLDVPEEAVLLWFMAPTTWWGDDARPVDHLDDADEVVRAFESHHGVAW